jgi:hypothetical protein
MTDRRRIEYTVGVNDQQFASGSKGIMGRLRDMAGSFGDTSTFIGKTTTALGGLGIALGGQKLLGYASDAIQLAVSAEEVRSKFDAVWGSANELKGKLSEWADMAGVTDTKALDLVATFGNLALAQGMSKESTEDLAEKVWTLAGDMASFNDSDPEAVFYDLNKAILTTEREGMKKFGIAVMENEVKQRAMEIAIKDGRSAVTDADRAMASYEIIVRQAGQANGDLERTADSAANQQRQLKADMQELQEEIGQKLLPVYSDLLQMTVDLAPLLTGVADGIGAMITPITGVSDAVRAATDDSGSFWDQLSRLNDAALKLVSPIGAVSQSTTTAGEDFIKAGHKAEELGAYVDTVSQGPLDRFLRKVQANKDKLYELAEAQREYRDAVESSFVPAMRTQEQWLDILNEKYRRMQGWESPWSKWGPPPPYYGDSQYNPGPQGGQTGATAQNEWNSINGGPV